jgi:putative oxidoreductase
MFRVDINPSGDSTMSLNSSTVSTVPASNAAVILIGRLLLSSLFLFAGFGKLTDIAGTAGWFGSIGLPLPTVVAVLVGLLELGGGLAILLGFKTRIAALALAAFTVAASLIAHTNFADQVQLLMFLKNISITGGLLVLASFGPGPLSIDAKRG